MSADVIHRVHHLHDIGVRQGSVACRIVLLAKLREMLSFHCSRSELIVLGGTQVNSIKCRSALHPLDCVLVVLVEVDVRYFTVLNGDPIVGGKIRPLSSAFWAEAITKDFT